MQPDNHEHLMIFKNHSVLVNAGGDTEVFAEGKPSKAAIARSKRVKEALRNGYLTDLIEQVRSGARVPTGVDPEHLALLEIFVATVNENQGRALIILSVLLLAIKDIEPSQSVRLHKAGNGEFSWQEGLPMRGLDANYITPALREHDLLKMNNDGGMMTRSLAENYPYTRLYKAAIRGARDEWLTLVDLVEMGRGVPRSLLEALISILINRSDRFTELGDRVLTKFKSYLDQKPSSGHIMTMIESHMKTAAYSARLLEVSMHAFFQVLEQEESLPGKLAPLSQMRSANKKHGNVGDIEIVDHKVSRFIIEAWDAKYGKPYLYDELNELDDKLELHPEVEIAGFVVDRQPEITADMMKRMADIEALHGVKVHIYSLREWLEVQIERSDSDRDELMSAWLLAYVESLALRRRQIAPIDEPAELWLEALENLM